MLFLLSVSKQEYRLVLINVYRTLVIFYAHSQKVIQSKSILHVTDGILLHIPELELEDLPSNPEMVESLEQCLMNWQTQITIVIEEQKNKKPQVCNCNFVF